MLPSHLVPFLHGLLPLSVVIQMHLRHPVFHNHLTCHSNPLSANSKYMLVNIEANTIHALTKSDRLEGFLRCASSWLLKTPIIKTVTTNVHMFTLFWLKANFRRFCPTRSFFSFRECSRNLEVIATWKKLLH